MTLAKSAIASSELLQFRVCDSSPPVSAFKWELVGLALINYMRAGREYALGLGTVAVGPIVVIGASVNSGNGPQAHKQHNKRARDFWVHEQIPERSVAESFNSSTKKSAAGGKPAAHF